MNTKRLMTAALTLTLLLSGAPVPEVKAQGELANLSLNGQPMSFTEPARLIGSTLMVPLRELSEALGVQVHYEESSGWVTAAKGDRSIRLKAGSREAFQGSAAAELEQSPVLAGSHLMVPLRFFSEAFDFNVYWDASSRSVAIMDADKSLPTVGSLAHLEELVKASAPAAGNDGLYGTFTDRMFTAAAPAAAGATEAGVAKSASDAPAHSTTNVQVDGVDEADVIKTDGEFIYQVNRSRIIVAKAAPAEQMSVVSTVYWEDDGFYPRELYVDDRHLIVIGSSTYDPGMHVPLPAGGAAEPGMDSSPALEPFSRKMAIWPGSQRSITKTIVYELGDRTNLKPVRETELEGHYVSSRRIGDQLYIVSNKSMNFQWLLRQDATEEQKRAGAAEPVYRDSAIGRSYITIGYEDIRYFPKSVEPNYLLISGMNLANPEQKMQVTSYLGSGQHVYASASNLYVTVNEYEESAQPADPAASPSILPGGGAQILPMPPRSMDETSVIYKFALKEGTAEYTGRGRVPGHPLNQFSMDEHNGHFRIATTSGDMWRTDEGTSKNNIYVLDDKMQVTGKLENLAPGERIYSVRYAGNRAYMVTFRNVDPLFVIDLQEPSQPQLLGKLKIPGYSDYLHPYDENHLIGFGKDTVEVPVKNEDGRILPPGQDTTALYQGMKLALFNVSDPANPKELFKTSIGDRGTYSELLHNHKALLFSKEKNLLAFPVTVMEVPQSAKSASPADPSAYGQFTYQGAYVYRLDPQQGFQLTGRITHLTEQELQQAGQYGYGGDRNIERLLYIGDTLYTASQGMLKASRLPDLQELGSLPLPEWKPQEAKTFVP